MALLCIDTVTNCCVIVLRKSKNESELALGFRECMNKLGNHLNSFVQMERLELDIAANFNYFKDNHITYVATETHPIFAKRMLVTLNSQVGETHKECRICNG